MSERVTIRAIAAGGDGVATLADGRTVFVPRAAPGDVVILADVKRHARFARALIGTLEVPGPDRVVPICPHYTAQRCGACQLMHLSPSAQLAVKGTIAGDALRRIGKLDVTDPPVIAAGAVLGYRSKMILAVAGGRMGYHPEGEATRVFDLHDCLLVVPEIRQLHAAVRSRFALLPKDATRVTFRRDRSGGLHLVVETSGTTWVGAARLYTAIGKLATIWWQGRQRGPEVAAGNLGSWPAIVFEQVNPTMAATVRAMAVQQLGEISGAAVWDLYAGIGETTQALMALGAQVASVEIDHAAVALAGTLGPDGAERHVGDVAQILPRLAPPRAIVTNPPRGGMAPAVTEQLARSGAHRIVYISCDPATLARDIHRLTLQYRLLDITAFDQFPQTGHLEAVAVLERREGE